MYIVENRLVYGSVSLSPYPSGLFSGGTLTWTSGANTGLISPVFGHVVDRDIRIELAERPPRLIVTGDSFVVRAGCDKTVATCSQRFANLVNFRGFPHMPGNDAAFSYVTTDQAHDGSSFFN